jgi:hypothetical protein
MIVAMNQMVMIMRGLILRELNLELEDMVALLSKASLVHLVVVAQ